MQGKDNLKNFIYVKLKKVINFLKYHTKSTDKPINPRISNILDHANKIKLPIKIIMKVISLFEINKETN